MHVFNIVDLLEFFFDGDCNEFFNLLRHGSGIRRRDRDDIEVNVRKRFAVELLSDRNNAHGHEKKRNDIDQKVIFNGKFCERFHET